MPRVKKCAAYNSYTFFPTYTAGKSPGKHGQRVKRWKAQEKAWQRRKLNCNRAMGTAASFKRMHTNGTADNYISFSVFNF